MSVFQAIAQEARSRKSGTKSNQDDQARHEIGEMSVDTGTYNQVNSVTSSKSSYVGVEDSNIKNNTAINTNGYDFRSLLKSTRSGKFSRLMEKYPTLENYAYMSDFAIMLTESGREVTLEDSFELLLYFYDRR